MNAVASSSIGPSLCAWAESSQAKSGFQASRMNERARRSGGKQLRQKP